MVKKEVSYTTSDGVTYKTKKSAERHENEVFMRKYGYSVGDVNNYLEELATMNRVIRVMLQNKTDWRDWGMHLVQQLPPLIDELKDERITYHILNDDGKSLYKEKSEELSEGEYPSGLQGYVDTLNKEAKKGDNFLLVFDKAERKKVYYKLIKQTLSPEEKLSRGIRLSEEEIEEFMWNNKEIYEERGDEGRWYVSMLTVVEDKQGNQYAISWSRGLTESQCNEFYNQPRRVRLEEREVVVTMIDVVYLED